jgi:hypothetical protein
MVFWLDGGLFVLRARSNLRVWNDRSAADVLRDWMDIAAQPPFVARPTFNGCVDARVSIFDDLQHQKAEEPANYENEWGAASLV